MTADWPRSLHELYSPAQVQLILRRARLRVDRCNGQMAVAVFELASGARATRWRLRRLARIVVKRSRATDDVGWITQRQVCAVLPDTSAFGAYRLGESVRALAGQRGLEVRYTVYSYPEHGDDDDDTGGLGERRVETLPAPSSARGVATATPVSLDRRQLIAFVDRAMISDFETPVRPLAALFRGRLPKWKRAMDIVGASIGLVAAVPVMATAALLIRASSSGPVIFRQRRAGFAGERFTILKFRTMIPDAEKLKPALRAQSEQDGPAFKLTHDPRVTLVGRLLRATSLDELPQFWNVLVGNMSLVGPRPLPIEESDGCDRWHRRRLDVMPGLTCIWQVRGRSRVTFDDWMRMDMEYIQRRSFLYDMKILLLTLPAVVLRRGAH